MSKSHITPARLLLPLAVAAALSLSGCGTESDDTSTDTSADTTSQEQSAGVAADSVTIQDPWVRATTGSEDPSMTAAFMSIDNEGTEEVTVVGATTPLTTMVELHEMASVDGEMVMQEVEGGIAIPAAQGQLLQAGGTHIMLMGLEEEVLPGDEVELTLELDDGSTVIVTAPVKEFTEETEHYHAPGTDEDHDH